MKAASRLFAIALFALPMLSGCKSSQPASGLVKVKLQADWYPQPEHGGFYDAIVKGYYKDEGLDVTIAGFSGGSKTLEALLDWSHRLLDESGRKLFRRLAVFTGGCTLEAAMHVEVAERCADLVETLIEI